MYRFDETTLETVEETSAGKHGLLTLTVVAHPDWRRVGDILQWSEGTLEVGRGAPEFYSPSSQARAPLADRYLSRRPTRFSLTSADVSIEPNGATEVSIDGEPLREARRIPLETLTRGITIGLGRRVLLLLHIRTALVLQTDVAGCIGHSAAIERARALALAVAPVTTSVLLRGETGTGKEVLAQAIHAMSHRAGRAFIAVNVAALAPSLAASELFGHVRGAFTGAARDHAGVFERSDGGTLFLDEIGDAPHEVQASLLRVLETGVVTRVGGTQSRQVDVRIIAATDASIEDEPDRFKSALLHRLSGFRIDMPRLRERPDDIARLLYHFIELDLAQHGLPSRSGQEPVWLPLHRVERLIHYDWPGNVRQLRNIARAIVIRFGRSGVVDDVMLPAATRAAIAQSRTSVDEAALPLSKPPPARRPMELGDHELVELLTRHEFNLANLARELGCSRGSLYERIDRCPLVRKASDLTQAEVEAALEQADADSRAAAERLGVSPRALSLRMSQLGMR